jgi:hypothetical protein
MSSLEGGTDIPCTREHFRFGQTQSGRAKAEFQLLPLQHTQATLICLKAGIWRLFPRE